VGKGKSIGRGGRVLIKGPRFFRTRKRKKKDRKKIQLLLPLIKKKGFRERADWHIMKSMNI